MPLMGQGNYIFDTVSAGHLIEWEQIANNPTPSFDYSGGVGAGFTTIVFPANCSTLVIVSVELDGDPATQALSSTLVLKNTAGSPVARTSTFTLANSGVDTVSKLCATVPFTFDSTWDNTGLEAVLTLGTGHTVGAAALSLLSIR